MSTFDLAGGLGHPSKLALEEEIEIDRTRTALVLASLALIASMVNAPLASAGTAIPCSGPQGMETVTFRTFRIDMKTDKKTYIRGETVKISAKVTRPADEDPLGQGQQIDRPTSEPAEGVIVGAGLSIGDVYLSDGAITDAKGKVTLKIRLEKYVRPGKGTLRFYGFKDVARTTCLIVQEDGYRIFENAIVVR